MITHSKIMNNYEISSKKHEKYLPQPCAPHIDILVVVGFLVLRLGGDGGNRRLAWSVDFVHSVRSGARVFNHLRAGHMA